MQTWIFQGNPDAFDIDGYLASRPPQPTWLVTRYASEIAVGDRVYLWRNQGKQKGVAGIVAQAVIIDPPALRDEELEGRPFWRSASPRGSAPQIRAVMRLVNVASPREEIRRDWCLEDPILKDLPNLGMQAGTNYRISREQALRLDALWSRTGRDWTRNESLAGLWAYAQTYGQEVSRLPGSPVSRVALLTGRAVTGVYAKVMNFRSLDPRAAGKGMTGAGQIDRTVWNEFFDTATSMLRTDALLAEFDRIWGNGNAVLPPEVGSDAAIVVDEAKLLVELTLEQLFATYSAQIVQRSHRPTVRVLNARAYERDPLVIAIALKRAAHRCEVHDCTHPSFQTADGLPYAEVHHIVPLAEGGEDTIENVACLCPSHHREVHFGARRADLTNQLKDTRSIVIPQQSHALDQVPAGGGERLHPMEVDKS